MQRIFFTIGYEGARVEDLIVALKEAGIETLIDVREVPLSRKRGFSKSGLTTVLEANGVRYVHLKGLGDPKPGREAARAGRQSLFRQIFGQHLTSTIAQRDLDRAVELVSDRLCCLMCFERDHTNCHRAIVAEHIVRRTGLSLRHLSTRELASSHEHCPHVAAHFEHFERHPGCSLGDCFDGNRRPHPGALK